MEINADHWQDQVDASSPVPLYAQLRSIIESHLDSDGYRAGDRLPSQSKGETYLKMGRDGVTPTILRGDQIEELASNSKLTQA